MNGFMRYLSKEIGIEFKACLYFFCILLFYCCYRVYRGENDASILVMAEMIFTTYVMGYIQVYLLRNFDEGDNFTVFGVIAAIICTGLYAGVSYLGKWFDQNLPVTAIFCFYLLFAYFCAFLIYRVKRNIDTKELNAELEQFKKNQKLE